MKILLVDDDDNYRVGLGDLLRSKQHLVFDYRDGISALNDITGGKISLNSIDLAVIDQKMPHMDGFGFAQELRLRGCSAVLVMLTAFSSVDDTRKALRDYKLYDYWVKQQDDREDSLSRNLDRVAGVIEQRNRAWRQSQMASGAAAHLGEPIGISDKFKQVLSEADQAAKTDDPVLITGESGTGKTLIAYRIHKTSKRSNSKWIQVNCSSIPESLFDGQLFGYRKGEFSGALDSDGLFKEADKGTLFLDEIGDIPLHVQAKLLTVIQTGEFRTAGGRENVHSNVRLICATNKNVDDPSILREDLKNRLFIRIDIPPLRERREDIRVLLEHYAHKNSFSFTEEAIEKLSNWAWPGNAYDVVKLVKQIARESPQGSIVPYNHESIRQFLSKNPNQIGYAINIPSELEIVNRRFKGIETVINGDINASPSKVATGAGFRGQHWSAVLNTFFTSNRTAKFLAYEEYVKSKFPKTLDYIKAHHKSAITNIISDEAAKNMYPRWFIDFIMK